MKMTGNNSIKGRHGHKESSRTQERGPRNETPGNENPGPVGSHSSDNKIVKWGKCKIGHHDYCVDHGHGEKHPITGWEGDGSKEMPDFYRPTG